MAVGCGGGGDGGPAPPRPVARGSALCGRLHARVTGRVRTPAASELSGLVLSRSRRHVLWTHNDSGDRPRLFAITTTGRPLGEVTVTGAQSLDWEDIAATREALYVGDIGDNLGQRSEIVVYRVPEPSPSEGATVPAERLPLRYPDRPQDAEALVVDPLNGALVVVTKSLSGSAGVYTAGAGGGELRHAGRIRLGNALAVTGGDVSADGRVVVVRTYDRALVWSRRRGESVVAALRRRPCTARADLLSEGQGEAIALTREGRAFYTVPERRQPALRRWAP